MSARDLSEFLEAKVNFNPTEQRRGKGGYIPPEYNEDEFEDERLRERERQGIEKQFNETKDILKTKNLTDGNDVFYELYTKARTSDQEVGSILNGLKAHVINYLDRKNHGILVLGTIEKLQKLSEGSLPKYITEKVRIIKPLTKEEQIEEELPRDSKIKMLKLYWPYHIFHV